MIQYYTVKGAGGGGATDTQHRNGGLHGNVSELTIISITITNTGSERHQEQTGDNRCLRMVAANPLSRQNNIDNNCFLSTLISR